MSVLFSCQHDRRSLRLLTWTVIATAMIAVVGSAATFAQDESEGQSLEQLWSGIVERYEVVVLSRSLLLEPLDFEVELKTIEVSDAGVAVDGEELESERVVEILGAEDAELVLALADLDHDARIALFDRVPTESVAGLPDAPDEPAPPESIEPTRVTSDAQVIVGKSHEIGADEVARDAVVFGGPLTIYGKVVGDATALGGDVTVAGEVTGSVVAVGGSVKLQDEAEVLGDVVAVGGGVERADGAEVMGEVVEVDFMPNLRFDGPGLIFRGRSGGGELDLDELTPIHIATTFMWAGFRLVVVALLAALVMLLARSPLGRVARRSAREPWKSGLVGLVSQILVLPLLIMVVLILCISIIGIPLLLLVPFACLALVLIAFMGFCAVCWNVGQFLCNRFGWSLGSPYLELILGIAAVQIWTVVGHLLDVGWGPLWFFGAMLCIIGAMLQYAAWTIGLGAAVLTRFGSAEGWKSEGTPQGPAPSASETELLAEGGERSASGAAPGASTEDPSFDRDDEPPIP